MIPITIDLSAVIFALREGALHVLCVDRPGSPPALPAGPFDPEGHRTFELGLRDFVTAQAGFKIGYVEQLYTFGDQGRGSGAARPISVGYMALTAAADEPGTPGARWVPVATFFPWAYGADSDALMAALTHWANTTPRRQRLAEVFHAVDDRVLDRYELLYEARLVTEAGGTTPGTGAAMASDHRRILATALSRLRAKIAYRPVIYELMPDEFTLSDLQTAIEAITGLRLHKQNFRRGVLATGHIAATGGMRTTSGRPAALYRVDAAGVLGNPAVGVSVPVVRG
jgi:hypothetical protein